jgi:two-component system, sporulation sensor kinase E
MGTEATLVTDGQRPDGVAQPLSADALRRKQRRDVVLIALMLGTITALHIFTPVDNPTQMLLHDFYKRLYYIPILYSAFVFGLRGGLTTAVASALLYAPFYRIGAGGVLGLGVDNLLEVVMYLIMGVLFGSMRDVEENRSSDLREVSRQLEDAYSVLEERAVQLISIQDYTQSILRSVTAGVVTVGPDASIATVNPSAEHMLGVTEELIVARALGTLFKDDGGLVEDVRKVLRGRIPRTVRDLTFTTAAGKTVHAQTSVSRMRDVGGRKLGAVVTIEDVSDIKSLTEQLIRADRLAAMGELTAGVAHEVRNPLGIIRASVQLMEDADGDTTRLHEAAEVIKQEIDRLDRVIKALLDFGRPALPTMRPVSVREVLEEVVLFSRTFASRGRVDIVEEYGDVVPDVMADPEQLKQVFVNLISNAVQAMADGGTLVVTTGVDAGYVYVRFTDDGPGIPPEMLGKVFDPFVSTRDDGTGLGLTIAHRIVDDHDGHIEAASGPGGGTTFTVWLPALQ